MIHASKLSVLVKTAGLPDLAQPKENEARPINLTYPRSTVIRGVPLSPLHVSIIPSADVAQMWDLRILLRYAVLQSLSLTISEVASIGFRLFFCHPPR